MFDNVSRTLYAIELKSTKGTLTFWRQDFEDENKSKFNIKKNQILGLQKWSANKSIVCGIIINFRTKNQTFFIYIDDFIKYTSSITKKSIGYNDVLKMNNIEISSELKITRNKYDINSFINETCLSYEV